MGVLVVMKQSAVETKLCIQPRPVTEVGESVEECCVREVMEESGGVGRPPLSAVCRQSGGCEDAGYQPTATAVPTSKKQNKTKHKP